MIEVRDRRAISDISFEEYLAMPGYSNSFFKNMRPEVSASDGVRLGKMVDAIIFEDDWHKYSDDPLFEVALLFSKEIKASVDLSRANKQVSLFAKFRYGEKELPVKGRADIIIGDLIVDLKVLNVSAKNLLGSINYFEYDTALNGYCMMANKPHWAILAYCRKDRKVVRYYRENASFNDVRWKIRIMSYGYNV